MQWSNNERNFEGIRVEVELCSSTNAYRRGASCYKIRVYEAKHSLGGRMRLPFTAEELSDKIRQISEETIPTYYFIEDDFKHCYTYLQEFDSEEQANLIAEKVKEAIEKLEEEKKGVERIKKVRRRVEDVLRKSDPETILRVAKQLGVKID